MRLLDCPACGHGFLKRKRGRCPRCECILVNEGEGFVREGGDRVFLWIPERREWSEVMA